VLDPLLSMLIIYNNLIFGKIIGLFKKSFKCRIHYYLC